MGRGGARSESASAVSDGKRPSVFPLAAGAFIGLRLLVLATGWRTYTYTDSGELRSAPGYADLPHVSFTGQAQRPPIVPAFYAVLRTDEARVLGQVVVSVGAWLVLAAVVAGLIRERRVRIAAVGWVLCAGATRSVTNWDFAILTESLAISALCLALAAWLWFASTPTVRRGAVVVVATAGLALIRLEVVVVLPVLAAGVGAVAVVAARRTPDGDTARSSAEGWAFVAMGMLLVTGWGLAVARGNEDVSAGRVRGMGRAAENVSQVVRVRVVHDPEVLETMTAMGMPRPEGLIALRARGVTGEEEFAAMVADPEFVSWASASGPPTLLRHSFVHPQLFPRQFARELPALLVPPDAKGAAYADSASVLPGPIEAVFTPTAESWPLPGPPVLCAVPVFAMALARCRRRTPVKAPFFVALGTVPVLLSLLFIGWLVSAMELVRHSVPFVMLLTVMAMVAALLLLDAAMNGPAPSSAGDAPESIAAAADMDDDATPEDNLTKRSS